MRTVLGGLLLVLLSGAVQAEDGLRLYAAGSLRAALSEVAEAFSQRYGIPVETTFAPSGLLRTRIEQGEPVDVFASANMSHPQALMAAGRGGPVALFARNRLCALAQPGVDIDSASVLDVILDPDIRLGTSTPGADPSGDYAWELFERAEALRPGSQTALDAKALQLTGGPDSAPAPAGRDLYAWVMDEDRADVFLTYCTNALLARAELSDLRIVQLPEELAVGADFGLTVLAPDRSDAWRLALFILAPEGQVLLARHGFISGALPVEE